MSLHINELLRRFPGYRMHPIYCGNRALKYNLDNIPRTLLWYIRHDHQTGQPITDKKQLKWPSDLQHISIRMRIAWIKKTYLPHCKPVWVARPFYINGDTLLSLVNPYHVYCHRNAIRSSDEPILHTNTGRHEWKRVWAAERYAAGYASGRYRVIRNIPEAIRQYLCQIDLPRLPSAYQPRIALGIGIPPTPIYNSAVRTIECHIGELWLYRTAEPEQRSALRAAITACTITDCAIDSI